MKKLSFSFTLGTSLGFPFHPSPFRDGLAQEMNVEPYGEGPGQVSEVARHWMKVMVLIAGQRVMLRGSSASESRAPEVRGQVRTEGPSLSNELRSSEEANGELRRSEL